MNTIEAVIVCVDYADVLAHTLPNNFKYFEKTVVVTHPTDFATKRICQIYGVEVVETELFYETGDIFNKGAAINEGLKHLSMNNWVLHLDADIWLHPFAIQQLNYLKLNPQFLYGCDRIMIESFVEWIKFLEMPDLYKENWLLELSNFKIGSRITQYYNGNMWQPLGFFQLWNPKGSNIYEYALNTDASKSDIEFASKWNRGRKSLIPEVIAIHLEEGESQSGSNWKGRTTPKFGFT